MQTRAADVGIKNNTTSNSLCLEPSVKLAYMRNTVALETEKKLLVNHWRRLIFYQKPENGFISETAGNIPRRERGTEIGSLDIWKIQLRCLDYAFPLSQKGECEMGEHCKSVGGQQEES
ncbi:hypothetical protein AVEN_190629-1 [Araneus ventricosus]|uniref:Uncharacterized protein n=1 Tax=Araneus ventricosus TaxID=182803 RepID=A0A4Y2DNT4_ARAVE|nr:hypothetical protein AVEN_190629-1 [Araneus ventricosus]